MKKLIFVVILLTIMFSSSACGRVESSKVKKLSTEPETNKIMIEVDISAETDPILYIKAKDIEIDRLNKKLIVKNVAFLWG